MRATQHPTNTGVLTPPSGIEDAECRPLPITRMRFEGGIVATLSWWEPNEAERRLIAQGRHVRFAIMGTTHAPIQIGVDGDGAIANLP